MLLKKISLENIRSYAKADVTFPEGVVLFEGDVGGGKSSILYAIEFALFGLGDLNASFLLRNSEQSGFVKLDFQVNGRNYQVYRSLERKKTSVQQGECWVVEEGVKTVYTPTEVKQAVLKILGFKEPPNPRSQSIIYRYAVFTPQEEMKKILEEKPEDRLQTLRKAFGVEDYRIARDNASVVLKGIREESRFLEGQAVDLPKLVQEQDELSSKISLLAREQDALQLKAKSAEEKLSSAKTALSQVQSQYAQYRSLQSEVPLLERQFEEKKNFLAEALEQADFLGKDEEDLRMQVSEIKIVDVDYSKTQAAYKALRAQSASLANELGGMQSRQRDYTLLKEKGMCPTCGQKISGDFDSHFQELSNAVKEKQSTLEKLKAEEEDLSSLLEQAVQQNALNARKQDLEKRIQKVALEKENFKQKISLFREELPKFEENLKAKQAQASSLQDVEAKVKELEQQVRYAENDFKAAFSEKTRAETQLQDSQARLKELEKRISEKKETLAKLQVAKERKTWLEEHFVASLSAIETHVLAGLNREFDLLFKKWFLLLTESQDLSVSAGEQFEPLVEINGYEQSYQTLSGGEKSAMALAYRLALNALVKSVSASMQENLLILDEPTDGFSKEQLGRMREVLKELNCKQVLLVSHERELEAFADKVFKVEKSGGLSAIAL